MPRYEFQKTTLDDKWTEFRIVLRRERTPDFHIHDEDARLKTSIFVLTLAGGIAAANGDPILGEVLVDFINEIA